MLKDAHNSQLYVEWLDYIDSEDTKDAFRYIVGLASALRDFRCHPQWKGKVRDFRFIENATNAMPFAFIPTKNWLLFYFRAPAIRSGKYSWEKLTRAFTTTAENNSGEWTVSLHDVNDVQRLFDLLNLK